MKLLDIISELKTKEKPIMGSGADHMVYAHGSGDKVIKVGLPEEVHKWLDIFKSNPDIFPIIYKTGITTADRSEFLDDPMADKPGTERIYVEMEKLDTAAFKHDWRILESMSQKALGKTLQDVVHKWNPESRMLTTNETEVQELGKFLDHKYPSLYDVFMKIMSVIFKVRQIKQNADVHLDQFGYDDDHNVKCLDI